MIRDYQDASLEQDVVERIVGHGLRAPSAGFSQGWAFLVLQAAVDRERFWQVAGEQDWLERHPTMRVAPLLVIPFSHKETYLDRYATRSRAGPTATKPGGRCPTGTSTPAWPPC